HAAAGLSRGEDVKRAAAIAKLHASDAAMVNAREATQIHGGYGFMNEFPVGRFYRDAKVLEIGEGTSEGQRMIIARDLGLQDGGRDVGARRSHGERTSEHPARNSARSPLASAVRNALALTTRPMWAAGRDAMGKSVESTTFGREDYRRYRRKVRQCLDVFAQMLDHFLFDEDKQMTGL